MKNSIKHKINRLIAITVIGVTIILLGISLIVVNQFNRTVANNMMLDALTAQALRVNSQQKSVEQAVLSIYEISRYVRQNYSKEHISEETDTHTELFRDTAVTIVNNVDGGSSVYFRLSPEYAGDGKQGFLYTKNKKTGELFLAENTDILAYDENDVEHVGWYYIPMQGTEGIWLSPYYNANLDLNMISYELPMYQGSFPVGVVGIDIDFDALINLIEDIDLYESSGACLVDSNTGDVFYNNCDLFKDGMAPELLEALSNMEKSYKMTSFDVDGTKYSMHFTTVNNGMKLVLYAKNADIYNVGKTLVLYGIIIFVAVFLISLFIAIRLSNRITEPIARINAATKEYAKGNWDVSLSCNTDDELKELTDSIVDMAHNTKDNISHLQDALVVAQEASKAKSTFLSNVSHDIRTPMNAIISYSQFAVSQPELSEKTYFYLSHILSASKHLLSLINATLEMSRIESGKTQINVIPCNIRELTQELGAMVHANIEEKHQSLHIDTSGIKNENIMCDSLRFNQVMINLVGNAVKFTEDGGQIFVTVKEDESKSLEKSLYHFSVRDTGIGIDEKFIDHIFSPFERESDVAARGIQGTGLGLAISKNLVEMMGGHISVKSKKGKGTEFLIDIVFSHSNSTDTLPELEENREKESEITQVDLSTLRVLLAEDNKVNRLIVKELIGEKVAVLDEAINGKEAVDQISNNEPGYYDLILMDVQMPEMNGYEATRAIRDMDNELRASIPIIAMTANAFEEDRQNAFMAGMDAHITKPIDVDVMMKTIGECVNK